MDLFTHEEMAEFRQSIAAQLRRYWLRNYMENRPLVQSGKCLTELPDLGFGKPAVVLGGAPIAEESLEQLKRLDCATIICCDKALPRILPTLKPDFVVALNTRKTEAVSLEEWFKDGTEGISLVVPVTVHPETVRLWKGDVYWMNPSNIDDDLILRIEQETRIPKFYRGLNSGEFATAIAGYMRPAEIALFGMWYAWRRREDLEIKDPDNYEVVEVVTKGERWWTNISWVVGRSAFLKLCVGISQQGTNLVNCSQGGILVDELLSEKDAKAFVDSWLDGG